MNLKEKKIFQVKNRAETPETLDIYIYDDIESDSYDYWTGETVESETSAAYFKNMLENAGDVKNINIYINSLGGSVYEGIGIYNQLKRHKAYKTVYIDGFACSIASVIAMAGDKVIMPKNTLMMVHNVWVWARGNAKQLRKIADDLDIMNTVAAEAYLSKAGEKLDNDTIREYMNEESYLTAAKCVELGLADGFADYDADLDKAKEMLDKANRLGEKNYAERLEKVYAYATNPPKEENPQNHSDVYESFKKYFFRKGE